MFKMIVCDMDGTLLDKSESISKKNLEAIKKCQEAGILFTIATGRSGQLLKPYVDLVGLHEPFVMCNGALIGHPFMEEVVYQDLLSDDEVYHVLKVAMKLESDYIVFTKDCLYTTDNYRKNHLLTVNEKLPKEKQINLEVIPCRNDLVFSNVNKMLLLETDPVKVEVIQKHLDMLGSLNVVASQKGFMDINRKGNNKGLAVKRLVEHYGFEDHEVVVFGDQDNDVEMLEMFPHSVCMENGSKRAKDAAFFITDSNDNDGVANWIYQNVFWNEQL